MLKRIISPLREAQELWGRLETAMTTKGSAARSGLRKRWKRSWAGKTAWPWLKREMEIVSKVAGVVVVSLWLKRLIEQFLGKKVLNEPVLRGEVNDIVRGIEDDVEQRRPAMFGRGNEIVVTVEPVKEEAKVRQEEVRAAAKNSGSSLREWIIEEAAWIVAQFTKVALSVAVVRGVQQLFKIGFASESAYQRAPDLWSHGYQDRDHQSASGGYDYRGGSAGSWHPRREGNAGGSAQTGGSGFDHAAGQTTPENPRYVTSVGGYHLYLHRKILKPGKQFWPCPLLYVSACETCFLFEYDHGGRPQCAPLVKLRMVLDGNDGGEDLDEIRDWIRRS